MMQAPVSVFSWTAIAVSLLACFAPLRAPAQDARKLDLSGADLIARGSEIFAKSCAVGYCHGSEGRAARGPQLRDREWDAQHLYAVTRDGIPDTAMPAWQGLLPDQDIWATVAYILSISKTPPQGQAAVVTLERESGPAGFERTAQEQLGHDLFFDLNNPRRCNICHELGGVGAPVGPDLAASASEKSERELLDAIVDPSATVPEDYELVAVHLRSGERVAGVVEDRGEETIRIFDIRSLPPPLRTLYRDEVASVGVLRQSPMPRGWERVYTREELRAIVAFLKSGKY